MLLEFDGHGTHQEEREDDTPQEQPPTNAKWNSDASVGGIWWTTVENRVRPCLGRQHGSCSIDIGHIDQETLDDDDIEPEVLHAHAKAVVCEFARIHEVELERQQRRDALNY